MPPSGVWATKGQIQWVETRLRLPTGQLAPGTQVGTIPTQKKWAPQSRWALLILPACRNLVPLEGKPQFSSKIYLYGLVAAAVAKYMEGKSRRSTSAA